MKISIDDKVIFELNATRIKLLGNEINEDFLVDTLGSRLKDDLAKMTDKMYLNLRTEWDPKLLASGVTMVPLDQDAYMDLVFARPDYRSKKQRG